VQASRRAQIEAGELALVLGCGPIGLMITEVFRARGAEVVATDVVHERMEIAAGFGARTVATDGLFPFIEELTKGQGMPIVVEATGSPFVMEQTVQLVAAGGRIVIVGLVKQGVDISIPALDITRKEMTILGSRASVGCFPEALELLATGAIRTTDYVTRYDLWSAPTVFSELAERPVLKGILIR
jgi:threonine dehydrogenase-like Zn-dependent dehydrogenase